MQASFQTFATYIKLSFQHIYSSFSGEYKLPEGVYLLLGFSAVDEALLRPHTGLGAEDAVRLLQQYLHNVSHDGVCDKKQ